MIINQNFTLNLGDSRTLQFQLPATTPDLTGCTANWYLGTQPNAQGDQIKVTKSTSTGNLAVLKNVETGEYTAIVVLVKADTEDLVVVDYYHELEFILASGKPYTASTGQVKVRETMRTGS